MIKLKEALDSIQDPLIYMDKHKNFRQIFHLLPTLSQ